MKPSKPLYHRHRFPPEIIQYAVWLYHRFCLSFRDVEDLLAERAITVSYETIRRWCTKFGPRYAKRLRKHYCGPQLFESWSCRVRHKAVLMVKPA